MTDTITFVLDDEFNKRRIELKMTLGGDHIDCYYEAFEAFLLAAGFSSQSIQQRYGEF